MTIRIVPHSHALTPAVDAFNRRMHAGGSPWGFYTDPCPDWIPLAEGAKAWREYYLAVEDDEHVRGAYALKPQEWLIRGEPEWVTDWQGPFTEGAVNPRYTTLGLRLIRDMLKKYPLLYSLGHGGSEEPVVQLLRSLGWTLHEMPFCFRVLQPGAFLRRNRYLRNSPGRARLLDLLAATGLGAVGVHALQSAIRLRYRGGSHSAVGRVVEEFGDWADTLWERCRSEYTCLAVRDRAMMNRLLPQTGWPGGTRLLVERSGTPIGWAVVHHKTMVDDSRFGDLRVGLVSDCFGALADASEILFAADKYLSDQNVDLIFSNQSHSAWVSGFRANGYVVLKNRRIFALSPELKARLEPFAETMQGLHLTNMDGHGPHGFDA